MISIALLIPTISTGMDFVEEPLFSVFLPSFLKTIHKSSSTNKFQYIVYLGHDVGDKLFDDHQRADELQKIFYDNVKDYPISLKTFAIQGMKGSPCWIWNVLAQRAFHDGIDYFYQVNDDLEFKTKGWTEIFITSLLSNRIHPNFGVVGPAD
jgi:hypothetical protein